MRSAKETHFCIRGLRPPHQIRRQNRCPYGSNSLATSSAISFANGHQLRSVIGDNLGGPNGCAIPLNRTTLLHTPLSVPSKMSRHFRQQVGSTCYAVPSILRTKLVPICTQRVRKRSLFLSIIPASLREQLSRNVYILRQKTAQRDTTFGSYGDRGEEHKGLRCHWHCQYHL